MPIHWVHKQPGEIMNDFLTPTNQEIGFIKVLLWGHSFKKSLARKGRTQGEINKVVDGYIRGISQRVEWGKIDKDQIIRFLQAKGYNQLGEILKRKEE
jgi:hypothetical protein